MNDEGGEQETADFLRQLVPLRPAVGALAVLAECERRAESSLSASRLQLRIWRVGACALAASLAVAIWKRGPEPWQPKVIIRIIHDHPLAPAPVLARASGDDSPPASCPYLILRQRVLSEGLAALPNPPAVSKPDAPLRDDGSINGTGL